MLFHPKLNDFVEMVRRDPESAGIMVDWLLERHARTEDVLELYALPPEWPALCGLCRGLRAHRPKSPTCLKCNGTGKVACPEPVEDDSLRSLLVAWLRSVEPTFARPGCLYYRWQEVALQVENPHAHEPRRELKRRILSLFEELWIDVVREALVLRQTKRGMDIDGHLSGLRMDLSSVRKVVMEESNGVVVARQRLKPSELIPPSS